MIRRAVGADSDALCSLLLRCPQSGGSAALATDRTPDFFRRAHPFAESSVLAVEGPGGALDATVTVAIKQVHVAGRRVIAGYVFDLAVDPAARGRGLATRVLREVEELAVAAGADLLYAHVMHGNLASSATFARVGYEQRAAIVARIFLAEPAPEDGVAAESEGAKTARDALSSADDWETAAVVIAGSANGHDLGRGHDGASLRREWTGLHGWRAGDVWLEGGAVLGIWDYAAVARFVPSTTGVLPTDVSAKGLHAGLVLGGAGDEATLGRLFTNALSRAAARGMNALFTGYDERVEPTWFGRREAIGEPYRLLAKVLRSGPSERLGERPVRVDPIDL